MFNDSSRDFWAEIKRLRGRKFCLSRIVDGLTETCSIAQLFEEKSRDLFSSVSHTPNFWWYRRCVCSWCVFWFGLSASFRILWILYPGWKRTRTMVVLSYHRITRLKKMLWNVQQHFELCSAFSVDLTLPNTGVELRLIFSDESFLSTISVEKDSTLTVASASTLVLTHMKRSGLTFSTLMFGLSKQLCLDIFIR